MPNDPNQPTEAVVGQPVGDVTPVAVSTEQQANEEKYLVLRNRTIEAERRAATLEAKAKKDDDNRLAEQGKFQELAKAKEAEAATWQQKYIQAQRQNALIAAGAKAGINDAGDLVLARLGDVDVADDAALRDAAEKAVSALTTSKPYLFGKTKTGTPYPTPTGNPGGVTEVRLPDRVTSADVANLTKEQKQLLVDRTFGTGAAGGGFFRK